MAEFMDVIRSKRRMCEHYKGLCAGCPLNGRHCGVISILCASDHVCEDIETAVTAWAAENPEPVYPTWFDYLLSIGAIPKSVPAGGVYQWIVESIKHNQIPAETAQKLGIEPKEG